ADDLQPDRQAVGGEAGGDGDGGLAREVERVRERHPAQHGDRLAVDLAGRLAAGGERRHRRRRRQEKIEAFGERAHLLPVLRHAGARAKVVSGGDAAAAADELHERRVQPLLGCRQLVRPRGVELRGDERRERLLEVLPARIDDLHVATERLELGGGVTGQLEYLGLDAREPEVGRPGDVETMDVARARVDVRAGLARQRLAVAVVAARDHVEHGRGIAHAAREWPDVRDVIPAGKADAQRHASVRGLQADEPAERGGDAHGAAAVAAEGNRAAAARDGGGGAAAAAAGRALEVPRVARHAEERALGHGLVSELRRGRLAEQHRARGLETADGYRVVLGDEIGVEPRAAGRTHAAREQHVLHRHGHAVQETERLALHHRDLRLAREPPRHVVGDETEGVEAGIDGVDAREDGFGELDRRELLAPDQGRALDGRAPDYVVRRHRYHRGIVSSATWPPTRRGCAATPPGVRPASRTATALR